MTANICLVTIHGIGFEQPPMYNDGELHPHVAGYADDLHKNLSQCLDQVQLSDDPNRARKQAGENGPIYVQSVWPGNTHNLEAGRSRLGTWNVVDTIKIDPITIDGNPALLYDGTGHIAHVALVYSQEEGQGALLGPAIETGLMALHSLSHYGHISSVGRSLFLDIQALWQHASDHQEHEDDDLKPSLRIRKDPGFPQHYPKHGAQHQKNQSPTGFLAVLRQLENDVAAYIYSNKLRERIRGFVLDALLRLACRDDVDGIVINSHSNGTVVAFDVLRELPPFAAKKIRGFVTAGSPLRKYAKLFDWGSTISTIPAITEWKNFFDPRDLVADPLYTPASWLVGDEDPIKTVRYRPINPLTGKIFQHPDPMTAYLYQALNPNTGTYNNINIHDVPVNNLKNSAGGGLKAHNYWDNEQEFIGPLSKMLKSLVISSP